MDILTSLFKKETIYHIEAYADFLSKTNSIDSFSFRNIFALYSSFFSSTLSLKTDKIMDTNQQ